MNEVIVCRDVRCRPSSWQARVKILSTGNPCEAIVSARGNSYHLIFGQQTNGSYLCIPDWNLGSELAQLSDVFWNTERLQNCCHMKNADAATIAQVLSYLSDIL